jgi:hypothetical protein
MILPLVPRDWHGALATRSMHTRLQYSTHRVRCGPARGGPNVGIQVLLVFLNRFPIQASTCCPSLPFERPHERFVVNAVQQCRELGACPSNHAEAKIVE